MVFRRGIRKARSCVFISDSLTFYNATEVSFYSFVAGNRVEHFAIYENLVFAITLKMLRFLTEDIEKVNSLDSKLFFISICYIRTSNILEVIDKLIKSSWNVNVPRP